MRSVIKVALFLIYPVFICFAQPLKSGFIDVGADKIYYETMGEGPAIVMIHDGIVHSAVWDAQFFYYSKNHTVIRYDRRNYGRSSAASEMFSNAEDLKVLFDHLKIDKAWLFGMSSGGGLAIDFALDYPEKVSGLVLVGAVVRGFGYTSHIFKRGGHLPPDLKGKDALIKYYITEDPYEIYSGNKSVREKVMKLLQEFPPKQGKDSAEHLEKRSDSKIPSYKRLSEIKVPALILVGEFDMPDVHAHAGAINAGISNSERDIIYNSGHLIPIEQPEAFNKRVDTFILDMSL